MGKNKTDFIGPYTWSKHLVWVEYAHNSLPTSATGFSPFKCVFGYQPPIFPDNKPEVSVPTTYNTIRKCSSIWAATWQVMIQQGDLVKKAVDRKRWPAPAYQPGQRVWLFAKSPPSWRHGLWVRSPSPGSSAPQQYCFVCPDPYVYTRPSI